MDYSFQPSGDTVKVSQALLDALNIRVNKSTLKRHLIEHPDYPSLQSISDTLVMFGVENLAMSVPSEKFASIPVPFVAQSIERADNSNRFILITNIDSASVTYYDPSSDNLIVAEPIVQFEERWLVNSVLLVNAEEAVDEPDYEETRVKQRNSKILLTGVFAVLPCLTVLMCLSTLSQRGYDSLGLVVYIMLMLAGVIITTVLLIYDIDKSNPVLRRICDHSKNRGCGAILNSRGNKIAGFSWSQIGFVYFLGGLLILLYNGLSSGIVQSLLSVINIASIPAIVYSLSYQLREKKWCRLCLSVQGILVVQLFISIYMSWYSVIIDSNFRFQDIQILVLSYSLPVMFLAALVPVYKSARHNENLAIKFIRLKRNPKVFDLLLKEEHRLPMADSSSLGILTGDPELEYDFTIVSSPSCSPCKDLHKQLKQLFKSNPDTKARIIFLTSGNSTDTDVILVKHLLAISEQSGPGVALDALSWWHDNELGDYSEFVKMYPLNTSLDSQDSKVESMNRWCRISGISFTPYVSIDGYHLPSKYSVDDLRVLLTR